MRRPHSMQVARRPAPRRTPVWFWVGVTMLLAACSSAGAGVQTGSLGESGAAGDGKGLPGQPGAVAPVTEPPIRAWPLTGIPLTDPGLARHAVVVAKIDNAPQARPQTGLNLADGCIEERVEGITRLLCMYHSQDADPVGPIRSARSSDVDLMGPLNRPVLMWSGGNNGVTAEILGAQDLGFLIEAGHPNNDGLYYRDNRRQIPHNLYSRTAVLRDAFAPAPTQAVRPLFSYRADGAALPATAVDTAGLTVDFGRGVEVDYVWDAARGGWDRFQVDESHPRGRSAFMDTDGQQVSPQNVVVLMVPYGVSAADPRSPLALTQGEGEAIVLTAGKVVHGRWKRPFSFSPWELRDAAGAIIELTPGRTWIGLPEAGGPAPTPIDAVAAGKLLGERR